MSFSGKLKILPFEEKKTNEISITLSALNRQVAFLDQMEQKIYLL